MKNSKESIRELLALADIKINGDRPWDIQVHNEKLYNRVLSVGALALGESYMDGWWDVKSLDQFFYKILDAQLEQNRPNPNFIFNLIKARLINMQSRDRSPKVAKEHYDIGNDFYAKMLDKRMLYTCAYWKNAKTLDEAQEQKLELICRKIDLKKTDRVLDIGCGWGSFAKYAAEKYGCHVTAVNISEEQVKFVRENCKGLPVEVILSDYRDVKGTFDKVVAIGIIEHVGYKNYQSFMKLIYSLLKDHGIFLLHGIGSNRTVFISDVWFDKYIFPNGMLPSIKQLGGAIEELFVMEDWHNFGPDYDKTLVAWFNNFDKHWPEFRAQYGDRFYRMWKYYLLSLAGGFRSRTNQLWQIVLSKDGIPGGYTSVR